MSKKEVIVDTCFFQKLSSDGQNIEDMKRVLGIFDYAPIVPPYIWEHEMDVFPYFDKLVNEGYVRKVRYQEFLRDEDKEIYELYFREIHSMLVERLSVKNKMISHLPENLSVDFFEFAKTKMSLGDVHMILMASFMNVPVILSEDSDIELLKTIVKNRLSFQKQELLVFSCMDLIKQIAAMDSCDISRGELKEIMKHIGYRKQWNEVALIFDSKGTVDKKE